MDLLKHKHSGFTGAITRTYNKGKEALEEDLSALNLGQLERHVESIHSADASFRKLQDELLESFSSDIILDE